MAKATSARIEVWIRASNWYVTIKLIHIASNTVSHERRKHIEVAYNLLDQKLIRMQIVILFHKKLIGMHYDKFLSN